jgi:iron complex outermembrane receptor protein
MRTVLSIFALLLSAPALATPPQALTAAQVPALLQPPAHGVRVIALWALDCAYCEPNLQALAALHARHPDIDVITVATDDVAQGDLLERRLHAAGADGLPSRAYADATPERLNYLIDPNWGGETPRTLVIRADGTRRGISGELTPQRLQSLLASPRSTTTEASR